MFVTHENASRTDGDYCQRCGKKLKPGRIVYLELDQRIDEYHDFGGVPENQSQGCFSFGPDCAEKCRAEARIALVVDGL